jgi:predicted DNA-binding transcriptional regulator AlpA
MSAQFPLPQRFLVTKDAARFLGVSRRTLEKHRSHGTGPKWSKVGGRVIYAFGDLSEWAERGAKRPTSDPTGATVPPATLDTPNAARFLGVSVRTLERHRVYRTGPKYTKVGRRIFYAVSDLREWAERGVKRSTSDPTAVLPARPVGEVRSGSASEPSASHFDTTQPDTIESSDFLSALTPTELSRCV